jgi:hypothetical protein
MKGDNTSAPPLKPAAAAFQGSRVRAEFRKSEVRSLLSNPSSGSTHTITVTFYMTDSSEPTEVYSQVTVTETSEDSSELTLEIDPDEWNLNFSNSSGTVEAFIRGEDINKIDLNSIEMQGDNPLAATLALAALSATRQGDHIHARFAKSQVIDLLLDPAEGTVHTIIVSFLETDGTERQELSAEITIEDDDDIEPEDLELEIDPDEWSLNFTNSSGTVEAFIKGEGIENIDLDSIEMAGDNPSALPLSAGSVSINNNHIHARFPMSQVIDLLLDPAEGTVHTITVSFLEVGGTDRIALTAEITIEDDDEIEPEDLELEIEPEEWNLNYSNSSGTVEAFIEGEGIENIDLDSIRMSGDNPSALPLSASSVSINNNHIHARFPKNQVIDLLLDPAEGTVHTITVSFLEVGGTEWIELTAQITIEDDDDEEEPSDLTLQLAPPVWNLNYPTTSGVVKAFIRGDGIEDIDLDSIEMMGDNPDAVPLVGTSTNLSGNHVQASFPKNQVLDLLLNPASGSIHTVTVTFMNKGGGARQELSTQVSITGKPE